MRFLGAASVVLYKDAGFRGDSRTLTGDVHNLGDVRFNDAASSLRVR